MDYEEEFEKMRELNEKYLDLFYEDLEKQGLSEKTIDKHIFNVEFYINDFLCYYGVQPMERGCYEVDSFMGDWFIRKAMWSNEASIKQNCASLKKFYKLMLDLNYIKKEDYDELVYSIKEGKQDWIDAVNKYNNVDYFDDGMDWFN